MLNFLTEEFDSPIGAYTDYDAYTDIDRTNLAKLKHIDLRVFRQNDELGLGHTMFALDSMRMSDLDDLTMLDLEGPLVINKGEHWNATVAVDATRGHFPILAQALTASTTTTITSTMTDDPVDISLVSGGILSIALPSFPAASILATSTVRLTDLAGVTVSIPFASSTTTMLTGNTEFTYPIANLSGIDLTHIVGVGFRITTTANCTFRCMAYRVLSPDWILAAIDRDTRYGRLRRGVPRNGDATAAAAFTQPIVWKATSPPGKYDPRPIDAEVSVVFNTGSASATNTFSLYFRELAADFMTQLDLDGTPQALLDGHPQPDVGEALYTGRTVGDLSHYSVGSLSAETVEDLGRTSDSTSASWIEFRTNWSPGASSVVITDTEGNNYTIPLSTPLAANQSYVLFASIEGTGVRMVIHTIDASNNIGSLVFDTLLINDDNIFKRRKGRFGWKASFSDGDAWIDTIRERKANYAEYRSLPFESTTPIVGAQLFVANSPAIEQFEYLVPSALVTPTTTVTEDTSKFTKGGSSYKISNSGGSPQQGVITNEFILSDFANTNIKFDLYYPSSATSQGARVRALLFDGPRIVPLLMPEILPDQWQTISLRLTLDQNIMSGRYRLMIFQPSSVSTTWWIDNVCIATRSVAWYGRTAINDPWNADNSTWMPFYNRVNTNDGVLFSERGNQLQIRANALTPTATINRIQFKPKYAQLGRFREGPETPNYNTYVHQATLRVGTLCTYTGSGEIELSDGTLLGDDQIAQYVWQFEDGTMATGKTVVKNWPGTGEWRVTLIILGRYGDTNYKNFSTFIP
jgi:hypothetical protein